LDVTRYPNSVGKLLKEDFKKCLVWRATLMYSPSTRQWSPFVML